MNDTIAAIASGIGNAAIGVIRVSGPESFPVVEKLYRNRKKELANLSSYSGHTAHYGFLCKGEQILDEVLLVLYRGPHSYTGEDSIEIDCHGGTFLMREIMEALIDAGCRAALPGEFTKRAFLNGRMDLSQAEAVMDVIDAENRLSLNNSIRQLGGSLGKKLHEIREAILYEAAYIESALDDPEHISLDGYPEELNEKLTPLFCSLEELLSSSDIGRYYKSGIRTVLLGKPNAGKSSLLNALLGTERAIVTDIPGTTRDLLEEPVDLGNLPLRLFDTAGIRKTGETVEQIGVDRARKQAETADLILLLIDGSRPFDTDDEEIFSYLSGGNILLLLTKSDLPQVVSEEELEKRFLERDLPVPQMLSVSVKEERGLSELTDAIRTLFLEQGKSGTSESAEVVTNLRQRELLRETKDSLLQVRQSIENGLPEDFFTIDLMAACQALGQITGETAADELVDTIFRRFCTGK